MRRILLNAMPAAAGTNQRKSLGDFGERLACAHLEASGYTIVDRNYRTREGEIDIIARKGDILAFVEVRCRRGSRMGAAADSITRAKAQRMVLMAEAYSSEHDELPEARRIDVIAIDFTAGGTLESLCHFKNAVFADQF